MGTMKENGEWRGGDSQITVMVGPSGGRQFVVRLGGQVAEGSKLSEGSEWNYCQL
jgi:hypothetical protein